MTNEQIMKALEEFHHRILKTNLSYHIWESEMMAVCEALNLINRLKAEIEKKNTEIDILIEKKDTLQDENSELMAEVEKVKEERDAMHRDLVTAEEYAFNLHIKQKTAKSEAIREFAEMFNSLLSDFDDYDTLHIYEIKDRIDILKEMVGDE